MGPVTNWEVLMDIYRELGSLWNMDYAVLLDICRTGNKQDPAS
jgi:hypothetical protein